MTFLFKVGCRPVEPIIWCVRLVWGYFRFRVFLTDLNQQSSAVIDDEQECGREISPQLSFAHIIQWRHISFRLTRNGISENTWLIFRTTALTTATFTPCFHSAHWRLRLFALFAFNCSCRTKQRLFTAPRWTKLTDHRQNKNNFVSHFAVLLLNPTVCVSRFSLSRPMVRSGTLSDLRWQEKNPLRSLRSLRKLSPNAPLVKDHLSAASSKSFLG